MQHAELMGFNSNAHTWIFVELLIVHFAYRSDQWLQETVALTMADHLVKQPSTTTFTCFLALIPSLRNINKSTFIEFIHVNEFH